MNFKHDELDKLSSKLPKPTGWKILVAMPADIDKVGSIFIPDSAKEQNRQSSMTGYVLAMGPEAYKDTSRYTVPWCAEGDYVLIKAFSGTRFQIGDREFRLINEDTVEAVVPHPEEVKRL